MNLEDSLKQLENVKVVINSALTELHEYDNKIISMHTEYDDLKTQYEALIKQNELLAYDLESSRRIHGEYSRLYNYWSNLPAFVKFLIGYKPTLTEVVSELEEVTVVKD